MLKVDDNLEIPAAEILFTAIRAPGPGGQNVNKVSSAVQLRFDIRQSAALDEDTRQRLLSRRDRRISKAGVIVIKSSRYRNQDRNKEDALQRLKNFIVKGLEEPKPRKKTSLPKAARKKRREEKSRRGHLKRLRKTPED